MFCALVRPVLVAYSHLNGKNIDKVHPLDVLFVEFHEVHSRHNHLIDYFNKVLGCLKLE